MCVNRYPGNKFYNGILDDEYRKLQINKKYFSALSGNFLKMNEILIFLSLLIQ
jgi:hypothetical protein